MSLVINHNLMAMNAARNLGNVYANLATSTQRLSSGLRVNSAADDAAGLAIRELMRSDITVLNQGIRNASDAISMIQTAEGALSVIDEKLIRMKELAEQAATGTYTTAQREIMNSEYQAMASEIDRIANATDFNGVKLLDGSLQNSHEGSGMKVHFGVGNDAAEDYYFINMSDMRATAQTGLRVGNSDLRDTLRTTHLNATSPTSTMPGIATASQFGIRYSDDFNNETPGNSTWNIYGYVDTGIHTEYTQRSVSDLVHDINQGRQATGTFTFSSFSSLSVGDSFTVNGFTITFTTAPNGVVGGSGLNQTAKTGFIGVGTSLTGATTMSGASVSLKVAAFLNTYVSSMGVYGIAEGTMSTGATFTGTTVHMFAKEFGAAGNAIGTAESVDGMTVGQTTLAHGGEKVLTASIYYDSTNNDYELQIQMNHGGEKNQVQTFVPYAFSTAADFNANDYIVGGAISGVDFDWGYGMNAAINGLSPEVKIVGLEKSTDWTQPQNGSGRTEWDGADILTQSAAQVALSALDTAINKKDTGRASLGALQNRLENTITNLQIQAENLQAAESRISDVDVATEMTTFTKNNILAQAATAMLSQANSLPQLALQLLGR